MEALGLYFVVEVSTVIILYVKTLYVSKMVGFVLDDDISTIC